MDFVFVALNTWRMRALAVPAWKRRAGARGTPSPSRCLVPALPGFAPMSSSPGSVAPPPSLPGSGRPRLLSSAAFRLDAPPATELGTPSNTWRACARTSSSPGRRRITSGPTCKSHVLRVMPFSTVRPHLAVSSPPSFYYYCNFFPRPLPPAQGFVFFRPPRHPPFSSSRALVFFFVLSDHG